MLFRSSFLREFCVNNDNRIAFGGSSGVYLAVGNMHYLFINLAIHLIKYYFIKAAVFYFLFIFSLFIFRLKLFHIHNFSVFMNFSLLFLYPFLLFLH